MQAKPLKAQNDVKQKRPDDKADRANRKAQESRRLENKLTQGGRSLRQDSKTNDSEGVASKQTSEQAGPTNDLFYKNQKDTDRNFLSGNEDDLWDEPDSVVAEVKATKKNVMKVSESDFESDAPAVPVERKLTRQSDLRNSKRGILSSNDNQ